MEEIIMYRAKDGTMFDDETKCQAYEVEFIIRKYEKVIKFWDVKKQPIPLIDILIDDKFDTAFYFQVQRVAESYYFDLVADLKQYAELDILHEHKKNIGDIIFFDDTVGRMGDWVSLDKRAEEARATLEELRGY